MRDEREFRLHCVVMDYLRHAAASELIYYHCPNGEARTLATGSRLKRMGVRRGVADICLVLPGGAAAFLELKAPGGVLSPEQLLFQQSCEWAGAPYAVARSLDEAVEILRDWGALRVRRAA